MNKVDEKITGELFDAIVAGDRPKSLTLARSVMKTAGAPEPTNIENQYPVWQKVVKQITKEQFAQAMKTGNLPPVKLTPMELDLLRGGSDILPGAHAGASGHGGSHTSFGGHFRGSMSVSGVGVIPAGSTVHFTHTVSGGGEASGGGSW